MESKAFENYTDRLRASLLDAGGVVGLVIMGSTAHAKFRDEWSDHDLWVVTETGAQDALVEDLSWLPDYRDILLVVTHGKHRRTVMYRNRHKTEFAVFDVNEAKEGKVERYRVLIDRDNIAELIESIHQHTIQEVQPKHDGLENLCVLLWTACERYKRGELLSARQWVDGFAVNQLLSLISSTEPAEDSKDPLDVRRRLELRSPELAAELLSQLGKTVPQAALGLLQIAERELKAKSPSLAWDKATMVGDWIRDV